MKSYISILKLDFEKNANAQIAAQMKAYMKGQFDYFGIKSPIRKELVKEFFKQNGLPKDENLKDFIKGIWFLPQREFKYVAIELMDMKIKVMDESWVDFAAELLVFESWWDTVDGISANVSGKLLQKFPHLAEEKSLNWSHSGNMWLQRMSLLFQLKYKSKTDTKLLTKYIEQHIDSKEFFIRKAIGWILREYAKTNPQWVVEFCNNHPNLSGLSRREALKRL
ncbi:MAG: DNA alkylation repair protein [Bacteroidales bacterium]|nr:DNA alkylation repair protein [Bacteroidales bacterium]